MKIIQSFWSKPFQTPYKNSFDSRAMGGFPFKRHFIYTWALSILRLKEHFQEVHLVTDDFGKQLMIDVFALPYTSFSTELNALDDMPTQFWCAGKLYVSAYTKCPFLHFDGDLILGDLFDKSILKQPLVAEFHYEDKPKNYEKVINQLCEPNANLLVFNEIKETISKPDFIYNEYNLGIVGGNDYEFLNVYAEKSLDMVAQNKNILLPDTVPVSFINCLIEQFNFYRMAQESNKKVTLCIEKKFDSTFDYQASILNQVTTDFSFVHLHGNYKLNYHELPERWLKHYYPDVYERINAIVLGLSNE